MVRRDRAPSASSWPDLSETYLDRARPQFNIDSYALLGSLAGLRLAMTKAVISSTVLDLPEHRREVLEACLRQKIFPLMMEHLPAIDADAIAASMQLVDEADIYIGIFAYRYGHQPAGHLISISEMEYERATTRDIPRLMFLIHEEHLVKRRDIETGDGEQKLETLKGRVNRVCARFVSPADLRAHVIEALAQWRIDTLSQAPTRGHD
jgi:Domain of unknown function (DUF4062)